MLAVLGLAVAAGADYAEAAALANVAAGLQGETAGVARLSRDDLDKCLSSLKGVPSGENPAPGRLDPPEVPSPALLHRGPAAARGTASAWFPG
jgi:hypothetical protein